MNYIVIDLEFNQPFEFERGEKTFVNEACPFEIIQVGAVKIDESFKVVDKKNIMIKPQLYPRMHPFVEKITGLKEEMFVGKQSFAEAFAEIKEFLLCKDDVLCVWGTSDVKLLYKNIIFYNLEQDYLPQKYINVQSLASKYLRVASGTAIGLKNAVETLDIVVDMPFHDALNDAIYTAEVFLKVKAEELEVSLFNTRDLIGEKSQSSFAYDTKKLYADAEKSFGRHLSRKEKNIVKKIYENGRINKYDHTRN